MIPTWNDVHLAIRDLHESGPDTDQILYAAERKLRFPLGPHDLLDYFTDRRVPNPIGETDDALAFVDLLVPEARVSLRNRCRDGLWSATVTRADVGAEAQAFATTLPFALVKAAVETRVDLDLLTEKDDADDQSS